MTSGILVPLRHAEYRAIWIASLFSNFGTLVLSVGASWEMTRLSSQPGMVALVQTMTLIPMMFFAILTGTAADIFNKKTIILIALSIMIFFSAALTLFTHFGLIGPNTLLILCFCIGCGTALYVPAWLASVADQVPQDDLPSAISLNLISFNIARSLGPALGGLIVGLGGAAAAFAVNSASYLVMIVAMVRWRLTRGKSKLPSERFGRAVISGLSYTIHSADARRILFRSGLFCAGGSAISALMPLIAKNVLNGGPGIYGLLLGGFGCGAVVGGVCSDRLRQMMPSETIFRVCSVTMGLAVALIALSQWIVLTLSLLLIAGAAWTLLVSVSSIAIQLCTSRWVAGRVLAMLQTVTYGSMALGSWMWGSLADYTSTSTAVAGSGLFLAASAIVGRWSPLPKLEAASPDIDQVLRDPDIRVPMHPRSGPVIIEASYRIPEANIDRFYQLMNEIQHVRQRNGAKGWTLLRDIEDPQIWLERYTCPTWQDYILQRNRGTLADLTLMQSVNALQILDTPSNVRRMLVRQPGIAWRNREDHLITTMP